MSDNAGARVVEIGTSGAAGRVRVVIIDGTVVGTTGSDREFRRRSIVNSIVTGA